MSRLIDADLLKENINNWYALVNEYGQTRITLSHDDILAKIDNMPTVCDIDAIRDEIAECLEAINHIKAMPIQLYTPNEIEARKLTYEQCLGFIDKHTKGSNRNGI